jgi:hypothetical protein
MSLRMYPVSAARWAQLAGTPVPADRTYEPVPRGERTHRFRDEHNRIRAHVAALLAEHTSARP